MNLYSQTIREPLSSIFSGNKTLNLSAQFWFLVAVIGQWIFVYYVTFFYGGTAVKGTFDKWNEVLPHGYIPGETMGNIAVALHMLLAIIIMLGGPLQLIPQLQKKAKKFHRLSGRVYIFTAFLISFDGLYMVLTRGTLGGPFQYTSIILNAILIMLCAGLAWRYAMTRNFKLHRQWVLRLFLVVNGVWFFRVGLMFWLMINGGPVGFDVETFQGPFLNFLGFAQYLLPLAILELYLFAQKKTSISIKLATSVCIFLLTLMMGIGIFAATMGMWLPRI